MNIKMKLGVGLAAALLIGSVTAYANGTSIIMYGQYVDGVANTAKTGPGSSVQTQNTDASQAANAVSDNTTSTDSAAAANNTSASGNATVSDDTTATATGTAQNSNTAATAETLELDKLGIPADATVLVTLKGDVNGDTGTLTLLTKQQSSDGKSSWIKINECTAKYGKAGLGKTKEGDNKTPIGVFKMNTPFGIKDAEAGFPSNYIKVDKDCYWNGDSASKLYNKLVSTKTYTDFKTSESEHLINYAPYYNYCIDSGYNADSTPYKGSAIFLHCVVGSENTHGCIAIPEDNMKEVLRSYAEGTTYIVISAN